MPKKITLQLLRKELKKLIDGSITFHGKIYDILSDRGNFDLSDDFLTKLKEECSEKYEEINKYLNDQHIHIVYYARNFENILLWEGLAFDELEKPFKSSLIELYNIIKFSENTAENKSEVKLKRHSVCSSNNFFPQSVKPNKKPKSDNKTTKPNSLHKQIYNTTVQQPAPQRHYKRNKRKPHKKIFRKRSSTKKIILFCLIGAGVLLILSCTEPEIFVGLVGLFSAIFQEKNSEGPSNNVQRELPVCGSSPWSEFFAQKFNTYEFKKITAKHGPGFCNLQVRGSTTLRGPSCKPPDYCGFVLPASDETVMICDNKFQVFILCDRKMIARVLETELRKRPLLPFKYFKPSNGPVIDNYTEFQKRCDLLFQDSSEEWCDLK